MKGVKKLSGKLKFPIVLTEYGDALSEYPNSDPEKYPQLSTCIGAHDICNGWMDIHEISKTHSAITCRKCGLRVVIPKEIDTYHKLKKYFVQFNS